MAVAILTDPKSWMRGPHVRFCVAVGGCGASWNRIQLPLAGRLPSRSPWRALSNRAASDSHAAAMLMSMELSASRSGQTLRAARQGEASRTAHDVAGSMRPFLVEVHVALRGRCQGVDSVDRSRGRCRCWWPLRRRAGDCVEGCPGRGGTFCWIGNLTIGALAGWISWPNAICYRLSPPWIGY
jgi:hypothetical protein